MEEIKQATYEIIDQMTDLAGKMSDQNFTRPLPVLLQNSIGKHYRHIIEFLEVMLSGAQSGEINYDLRKHDPDLEQSRDKCMERLGRIREAIAVEPAVTLELMGSYSREADKTFTVPTNLERELVYNIEHAIHHMAIIRIALQQEFPEIQVPKEFGFAYSTLKHLKK